MIIGWLSSFIVILPWPDHDNAVAQEVYTCVWRNPERTMSRLFPSARDYRTVNLHIPPAKLARVEERSGAPMLTGQREQFQYFEMLDGNGQLIGYTLAATQKGEFGAIEFVFGLNRERKIIGLYIQRARERSRDFREETFLSRFTGIGVTDADTLTDPAAEAGTIATKAVTQGIKKELVAMDELVFNP